MQLCAASDRECYRLHQLLRELLHSELLREEPVLTPALHRRASEWYATHGDLAAAVDHGLATNDDAYVDTIVWTSFVPFVGGGYLDTVASWLAAFSHDQQATRPTLAVVSAWFALTAGDTASVRVWADICARMDAADVLPDGTTLGSATALLRSLVAPDGVEAMLRDARRARAKAWRRPRRCGRWCCSSRVTACACSDVTTRRPACSRKARHSADW